MSSTVTLGSVSSALMDEAAASFLADLRAIGDELERSAKIRTGAEQLTVNDHALPFFRRSVAGHNTAFPLLSRMQTSSVLLTPADVPGAAVKMDGEDYGVWEILPLREVIVEAIAGLPYLGVRRPPVERLAGGKRKDTTEDDAVLLLTALSSWGERAVRQGGCLWIIA